MQSSDTDANRTLFSDLLSKEFSNQQSEVAFSSVLGHLQVGDIPAVVEHRDAFRSDFGDQARCLLYPVQQPAALPIQIVELERVKVVEIDDGIIEEAAREPQSELTISGIVGVRPLFFDEHLHTGG